VSPAARCIRLLVNPEADGGRAGRRTRAVVRALEAHGLVVQTATPHNREEVSELAASVAREGETVVTLGGDGIAGTAADALRRIPGSVLGIIPAGRGNDLARVLQIPSDPLAACAVIARGAVREMDLGEVDGRAFVGIASAGFDSDANRIANAAPSWLGSGVYAYGALRALVRWRPASFQVELVARGGAREARTADEGTPAEPSVKRIELSGFSVAFANSRCFGGGMRLAPAAMLDDGLLDMIAIAHMRRPVYAWHLRKVFDGSHLRLPAVSHETLTEAVISADRPFTMYADGDPIGELPVRVRVLERAIGVLSPTAAVDAFSEKPLSESLTAPARVASPGGHAAADAPAREERAAGSQTVA
jgi:diacylglycerol kinase family enzyme